MLTQKEIVERNEKIYDLKTTGFSYKDIGDKFNLSRERIRQIVEREHRRKKYQKKEEIHLKNVECGTEKYLFSDAIREAGIKHNHQSCIEVRLYNCLGRDAILYSIDNMGVDPNSYEDEDLMSIRNFGVACLDLWHQALDVWNERINKEQSC